MGRSWPKRFSYSKASTGAGGAPLLDQVVEEGADGGLERRLAARLAGRQQDAAHDGLAALQLGLHLGDLGQQLGVGGEMRHAPPVAQDHRQRGQRRAQVVRGARGQQAHAHDVLFLGGALAQRGQPGVAGAQVAADAGDEDHQQRRVQRRSRSACPGCTGSAGRARAPAAAASGPLKIASPAKQALVMPTMVQVDQGFSSTAPRITCSRYRKTKGLVGAAAQVELRGQRARRRPAARRTARRC